MACPPFSWSVDAIFLAAFMLWLSVSNRRLGWRANEWRGVSTVLLLIVRVTLTVVEFSRRRIPAIVGVPADHLVVIGDSISSGIGPRVPARPIVMQQQTGVPVKNLSRRGAQAIEALDMA